MSITPNNRRSSSFRSLFLLGGIAGAFLVMLVRARMARWGATDDEAWEALPGDDRVQDADIETTRAVTIAAEPAAVWPWIVQMGQGRGGMYTYDWLENLSGLEMHSAERILPEWQGLKVGDLVPLEPGGSGYQVAAIEPERLLLLYVDESSPGMLGREMARAGGVSTWAWMLRRAPGSGTRLVVRWRQRYGWRWRDPFALMLRLLLNPVEFVMERRMLLGIRERAER
jgi:hypothetical protein